MVTAQGGTASATFSPDMTVILPSGRAVSGDEATAWASLHSAAVGKTDGPAASRSGGAAATFGGDTRGSDTLAPGR